MAPEQVLQLARRPFPWRKALGLAAIAALLAGCSGAGALNALQPGLGLRQTRGIPYGDDPRQVLDVYAPRGNRTGAPVVVFFYGGNWNSGDRAMYAFVGRSLADEGFVAVIPDYRVYPQVRWPDFLRDSARAVRWARDNAQRFGGDPGKLVLAGHSAGAYNAVDLATDGRWLTEVGLKKSDIRAVVGLAGPYDFLPVRTDELRTIFGPEGQRPDTQPINHVRGDEPPMLFLSAIDDKIVDPGNGPRMAARLRAAGSRVEVQQFPRLNHATTIGAFAPAIRFLAPVFARTVAFIRAHTEAAP